MQTTLQWVVVYLLMLNYNGGAMLLETLESLYTVAAGAEFKLVLVDNGSTDHSLEAVRNQYPQLEIVETGENLGFAKGMNIGSKHVPAEAEFICLVQPDMTFTPNWLLELVTELRRGGDSLAAVSPLAYYSEKYALLPAQSDGSAYLYCSDHRAMSRVTSPIDSNYQGVVLEIGGEVMDFIRPSEGVFELLQGESAEAGVDLIVYDENCAGFEFEIAGQKLKQGRVEAFFRKVAFKLTGNLKLKLKRFQLPGFSTGSSTGQPPELHYIVNSTGLGFREGKVLPDNLPTHGLTQTEFEATATAKEPTQIPLFYGACVVLRAKELRKQGGFDPSFFMYCEDVDLSIRLRLSGLRFRSVPSSVIYHRERGNRSDNSIRLIQEGQKRFLEKWQARKKIGEFRKFLKIQFTT